MEFSAALASAFPGAMPEPQLVQRFTEAVAAHGFTAENTIATVSVCRDELCRPLLAEVQQSWGEAFDLTGLAGFPFGGKTALTAALHHAPSGERARYAFVVFAHTALDEEGQAGVCSRPGMDHPSSACGALVGFLGELQRGQVPVQLDLDDVEQSLLRHKLMARLPYGQVPSLFALTRLAHRVIVEDLQRLISATVDPEKADWAVLTGIQIHGPHGDWAWPGEAYAMVNGEKRVLELG